MLNTKGFTYIETIFAFALFLISMLSIYAIYNQLSNNIAYTQKNYKAALIAENILIEVKASLNKQLMSSNGITVPIDLAELLGMSGDNFDKMYDSENYDITLALCKLQNSNENGFSTEFLSYRGNVVNIDLSTVSIEDKTGKKSFYDSDETLTQSNYLIQISISDKSGKIVVDSLTDIFIACP